MSAFGITPVSTSVPLDGTRRGTASFTVSNETGHAVSVRVAIVGAGTPAADPDWLTAPERAERFMAVDASDRFSVSIEVPEDVDGGAYHFRLDAVSVELPDEEWANGPVVRFVVPERPPEPEPETAPEPLPVPRRGYLATAVGSLLGGIGGGVAAGIAGMLLAMSGLTSSDTATESGAAAEDAFGGAIAEAVGLAIVAVILVLVVAALGIWIGSAVGSYVALRMRRYDNAGTTAVTLAILFPFWFIATMFAVGLIGDAAPDVVQVILLIAAVPLATIPVALASRGIHRFRTTGGL